MIVPVRAALPEGARLRRPGPRRARFPFGLISQVVHRFIDDRDTGAFAQFKSRM